MSLRGSNFSASARGTVILVALCFVAVMAIVLGSYLAVCTRAMQLSNRGFQAGLSKQLAEAGIDEALRAFNKNDWSDWSGSGMTVDWDTTTYAADKRAVATISFPSTKFGQGATAEVKVRVDNNDAHVLASATWSNASKTYQIYDVVGYNGAWYRCLQTHTSSSSNGPPNLEYWAEAPIPWTWSSDITYAPYEIVNYNSIWYRCILSTSGVSPAPIPTLPQSWSSSTTYYQSDLVLYANRLYRCTTTSVLSSTDPSADATNWDENIYWLPIRSGQPWVTGTSYSADDIVNYSGLQYRCLSPHTSAASFASDSANWTSIFSSVSLAWATGTFYPRGALVYNTSTDAWYYCATAHTSGTFATDLAATPPKWTQLTSSALTDNWDSAATYLPGDYAYYSSAWYRCLNTHTNQTPAGGTYWTTAAASRRPYISWAYISNVVYAFNHVVYYNETWYRRDVNSTTTNQVPTNTSYWENALSDSWDWNSSDDYNIGDVVYLSSTASFYRCIQAHTTSHTPPNTTYWSTEPPFSTYWDEGKNYGLNDVVRYRGSWYLNLTGTNTRPGINDDDWAIAPNSITPWSSAKIYHVDDIVSASGNWYRCKKDHTNQAVGNDNTYWVQVAGPSRVWSASTAYAANSYVSYAGAWYKCLTATTANAGHSPNNPTYWTPTWSQSAGVTTGAPIVYAEATVTLGDRTTSRTQLRALVDPAPLFPNAAGATTTLTITGGTGRVDSYDSELADYNSTDAGYAAVLAAGTGSASGTSTLLSVGASTSTRGYFSAPSSSSTPFAPRAAYDTSADLKNPDGTVTSPDGTASNVDLTRMSRAPYIPDFAIQTPIQQTSIPTSLPSTSASLNLGTPGAPTPSVYYYSGNLTISANETININGPVILRLTGYLRCNTGTFRVNSTGSVVVYSPYYLRSYASAGGFQNLTKDPKKMVFINTSATSLSAANYLAAPASDPEFYGAIYLPNTTATLGLDVRTGVDVYGALSAREITFSAEANLHYDTSLRYATFTGVDQPYTVTTWRELGASEQATMP